MVAYDSMEIYTPTCHKPWLPVCHRRNAIKMNSVGIKIDFALKHILNHPSQSRGLIKQ